MSNADPHNPHWQPRGPGPQSGAQVTHQPMGFQMQNWNCVPTRGEEAKPGFSPSLGPLLQPTAARQPPWVVASTGGCAWSLDWGWWKFLPHQGTTEHAWLCQPRQGRSRYALPRDSVGQRLPDPDPLHAYAQVPVRDRGGSSHWVGTEGGKSGRWHLVY